MNKYYEYDIELDENSCRSLQPKDIKIKLNAHQLACIYKAKIMEQNGNIKYKKIITDYLNGTVTDDIITVNTNIGILGDIVGYGKTLTALGIISECSLNDIQLYKKFTNNLISNRNYSYISCESTNKNSYDFSTINSTLIIVPRGPVYSQWEKSLENYTNLKYLAIDNLMFIKKNLPAMKDENYEEIITYFNQFDVVLIKSTTLDILFSLYETGGIFNKPFIKSWKRIIIDEAHDICNKIPIMYYNYLWLISGTYNKIMNNVRYCPNIREVITYDNINLITVKCTKDFVKNSFEIPEPIEKYYKCKIPAHFNAIRQLISNSLIDRFNANDIIGIIKDLGGKSDTNDNVVDLVCQEIKKEIFNKEKEKEYIASLDIAEEFKATRIKNIDIELKLKNEKLKDLTDRISELTHKMCSICMCDIERPIVLECTHAYCATCILKWLDKSYNCPECRIKIDVNKMIAITNEISIPNTILSKEDTLIKIIKDKPEGKFLVFSKYDSGFVKLANMLKANGIKSSELKGNTSCMLNILDKFKIGELNVILLNTNFAGSGIDISFATDVVLFHSMGIEKHQAIGRAQRVGRKDILNIHYLYYDHEMEE